MAKSANVVIKDNDFSIRHLPSSQLIRCLARHFPDVDPTGFPGLSWATRGSRLGLIPTSARGNIFQFPSSDKKHLAEEAITTIHTFEGLFHYKPQDYHDRSARL